MNKKVPEITESVETLKALLRKAIKKHEIQRLNTLYLLKSGVAKNRLQVADLLGVHRLSVGDWLSAYETGGLEKLLQRGYAPGRRPILTEEQQTLFGGDTEQRTDLISLVRYAMEDNRFLEPFGTTVNRNFKEWVTGKDFTPEQHEWLEMIRDHIATSLDIQMSDFEYTPFAELGNGAKVYQLFGDDLNNILTDLTEKLVS